VGLYSQGLSFYSGQVFHLLDFRTELEFGRSLKPGSGRFFANPAAMTAFVSSRPLVFLFLKAREVPALQEGLSGAYQLLARHKDCVLLSYKRK
jgi:hypothetical protein